MTTPEGPYRVETVPRTTHGFHDWHYIRGPVDFAAGFDKRDEAQEITNRLNAQHAEIDALKLVISRQNDAMKSQADMIANDSAEIERLRKIELAAHAYLEKWQRPENTGLTAAFYALAGALGYGNPIADEDEE
jgi:hypothetical protein